MGPMGPMGPHGPNGQAGQAGQAGRPAGQACQPAWLPGQASQAGHGRGGGVRGRQEPCWSRIHMYVGPLDFGHWCLEIIMWEHDDGPEVSEWHMKNDSIMIQKCSKK